MPFRLIVLCALFLLCATACLSEGVSAEDKKRVLAILSAVDLAQPATLVLCEETLVNQGEPLLPAMRAVLVDLTADFTIAVADDRKLGDLPLLYAKRDVLDRAIIRLVWKINPPQLIEQWVQDNGKDIGGLALPRPQRFVDARLAKLFQKHLIYLVRFRQSIVARMLPEPLVANNIFAVDKEGKVRHITDADGLKGLFKDGLPPINNESAAKEALFAWLRIAEELVQDGKYQFTIPVDAITTTKTDDGITVTGKAVVKAVSANQGELTVTLVFVHGELTDYKQSNTLRPKLLDLGATENH